MFDPMPRELPLVLADADMLGLNTPAIDKMMRDMPHRGERVNAMTDAQKIETGHDTLKRIFEMQEGAELINPEMRDAANRLVKDIVRRIGPMSVAIARAYEEQQNRGGRGW